VEISASFVPAPLTEPLLSGKVLPRDLELRWDGYGPSATTNEIIEKNSRRMVALELDVAEMSFGTFTAARAHGVPIVALPVYPGRRFLQHGTYFARHAGIQTPADLRGKRVGLAQFWMTASVWHRLILRQSHGVNQDEVTWVTTQPERGDWLPEPPGVRIEPDLSGSPEELLVSGRVDAIMSPRPVVRVGESLIPAHPDPVAVQRDYYQKTGVFPIIHLIVVRQALVEGEPWIVESLCNAFEEAKRHGRDAAIASPGDTPIWGGKPEDVRPLFGDDPFPYGVTANRRVLEAWLADMYEHQHMIDRPLAVEELFPANLPASFR
jgi:4,5-dihydroxyphthalate decarboxylase